MADNRASVIIFSGAGDGTFARTMLLPTLSDDPLLSDGTASLATGDVDLGDVGGDGRLDAVAVNLEHGSCRCCSERGTGRSRRHKRCR